MDGPSRDLGVGANVQRTSLGRSQDKPQDEVVHNEKALDTAAALREQQLAEFHDDEKD